MKTFKREYVLSPIEFVKFQLYQSINFPIPLLNETDITILSYIAVYEDDARDKILSDRILTAMNSVYNYFGRLKNMNYVVKTEKGFRLNPAIKIVNEDHYQVNVIKLDPESSKVFHPYYKR